MEAEKHCLCLEHLDYFDILLLESRLSNTFVPTYLSFQIPVGLPRLVPEADEPLLPRVHRVPAQRRLHAVPEVGLPLGVLRHLAGIELPDILHFSKNVSSS